VVAKLSASGARVALVGELPWSEAAMNIGAGSCRGDEVERELVLELKLGFGLERELVLVLELELEFGLERELVLVLELKLEFGSEAAMNTGEGSCRGDEVVAAWSGGAGLSVVAAWSGGAGLSVVAAWSGSAGLSVVAAWLGSRNRGRMGPVEMERELMLVLELKLEFGLGR
jgi:hypothetical protein